LLTAGVVAAATWMQTAFVPPQASTAAAGKVSMMENTAAAAKAENRMVISRGLGHHRLYRGLQTGSKLLSEFHPAAP
jgi:hypothetical protein